MEGEAMKKMVITVDLRECAQFQEAILDCPQLSKQLKPEYSDVWMSEFKDEDEYEELLCDVEDQLQSWGISEYEIEEVESDDLEDEDDECRMDGLDPGFSSWDDYYRYKFG